jgi:hypothetical protein
LKLQLRAKKKLIEELNHKEEVIKILKRKIDNTEKDYEKETSLKKELHKSFKILEEN